jgi:ribonucleoside-diphosphate reductase, alpha subunit
MTSEMIKVTKRDGRLENLDIEKIHRVVSWAAEGLDVSPSEVELKAQIQLYNGIHTEAIHATLIKSAADLISLENPDYQYMAARLAVFNIRKIAYGEYTPPRLYTHIHSMIEKGIYDKEILEKYTEEEIDLIESFVDHNRDMNFAYAGIKQIESKYLVQNRVTKRVYESPQIAFILIPTCLFADYPKETRIDYIKKFYNALSLFKISLPTPIMTGVRTPTKQFASCCVIDCDDTLDSINAATSSIVKYISQRAGIGINGGRIRALGSEIRKGEAIHTGVIPFWKMFQAAVKSCSQGGIRGGAATLFYPIWHLEVESLLVLKNNRGVEDNRIRQLDYGVQINRLMYQRLIEDKDITLLSPHSVEGLYDAYFNDQELFEKLYVEAENNPLIPKKTIKATELFTLLMSERANTGRIYIMNVDHANTHSSFIEKEATIYTSNLCLEITLPIKPLNNILDEEGEVALCILGALNLGSVDKDNLDDIEESMDLIVRALDSVLDYQNYPVKAARNSVDKYRPLGIGVINYAYYLAKNGARYSNASGHKLTHELFEAIQYYALKSSVQLAKEKGKCGAFENTKYSKGILPIDTYKKSIDEFASFDYRLDWESLRKDIVEYGLRNATLTSLMPSESSSQVSNATNGIDLPRGPITVKASKDGILKQVVPEYDKLGYDYEYLWYDSNNIGMLKLVAIMQKFVDQSISTNTRYNPANYPNGKVPMKEMLKELLLAYKYGVKTLYYHHTNDGSDDTQDSLDDGCAGGACKI